MPSPFPGMDPYLESPVEWEDFHHTYTVTWRAALNKLLPSPYIARINVNTNFIELDPREVKLIEPDVAIVREPGGQMENRGTGGVALIEPFTRTLPTVEEVKERWIEIIRRPDDTLVAVLELLSPWNKASGSGRGEYLGKRSKLIHHEIHLVEVDLLLGGLRLPMVDGLPPGDYYALVSRGDRRPKSEVYPWVLPQPLPRIPIPLLSGDADVIVDLEEVFHAAYELGGYAQRVKYHRPLTGVPIPEIHHEWALALAKSATPA